MDFFLKKNKNDKPSKNDLEQPIDELTKEVNDNDDKQFNLKKQVLSKSISFMVNNYKKAILSVSKILTSTEFENDFFNNEANKLKITKLEEEISKLDCNTDVYKDLDIKKEELVRLKQENESLQQVKISGIDIKIKNNLSIINQIESVVKKAEEIVNKLSNLQNQKLYLMIMSYTLEECLEFYGKMKFKQDYSKWIINATQYYSINEFDKALEYLEKFFSSYNKYDNHVLMLVYAKLLEKQFRYQEAKNIIIKVIELVPDLAESHELLARLHKSLGENKESEVEEFLNYMLSENVPLEHLKEDTLYPDNFYSKKISLGDYIHKLEEKSFKEVKKIIFAEDVLKEYYINYSEELFKPDIIGKTVKCTENQFSYIYKMIREMCNKLDIKEIPEAYIYEYYFYNVFAKGINRPWLEISAQTLEDFTEEELKFLIAKELVAIKNNYITWNILIDQCLEAVEYINMIPGGVGDVINLIGGTEPIKMSLKIGTFKWRRITEYSSDACAYLLVGKLKPCISAIIKTVLNSPRLPNKIIMKDYLNQGNDINKLNSTVALYTRLDESKPYGPFRVLELIKFISSEKTKNYFI